MSQKPRWNLGKNVGKLSLGKEDTSKYAKCFAKRMFLVLKGVRTGSNNMPCMRFRLDIKTLQEHCSRPPVPPSSEGFLRGGNTNCYPDIRNNASENKIVQIIYQHFIQL